jgi:hypothetical protein
MSKKYSKKGSKKYRKHYKKTLKRKNLFGLGYEAQTSFPNAKAAPYFGYEEPFINASEFWYPVSDGAYQSPQMLKNFSSFGRMRPMKSYIKDIANSMRPHKKSNPYLLKDASGSYKDYLKGLKKDNDMWDMKQGAADMLKKYKAHLKFGRKSKKFHKKCHKKSKKCYKK